MVSRVVTVRRITAVEGMILKRVRLTALADTPSAFGSTFEAEHAMADHQWVERAVAGSDGPLRTTFLAEEGGEVVGLAGGYRPVPESEIVELVSMWTAPDQRRRSTGRALVEAVLGWAAATGASTVSLWVTEGNAAALGLYESCGFRLTGERQPLPSDPSRVELRMRCGDW